MSAMPRPGSDQREISLDGDDALVAEQLYAWGWTDGLPVVPPTRERVARFCAAALHDGEHSLGLHLVVIDDLAHQASRRQILAIPENRCVEREGHPIGVKAQ